MAVVARSAEWERLPAFLRGVLYGGLGALVLLTLLLTALNPLWTPAIPLALLGVALLFQLGNRPFVALTCVVGGFALVVVSEPGLDPFEVLYGLFFVGYMAIWYAQRFFSGTRMALSVGDYVAGTWLVLGLTLAPVMGILHGAELSTIRGHFTGFWMLLLYFPVKETCRTHAKASTMLLTVFLVLGVYVSIRTFMNFREIVLAATMEWQIADTRPGYNALQLVMALVASLALLIYAQQWKARGVLVFVFLMCLGSLVLIKYRGFWVSCLISFLVLVVLLDPEARRKVLLFGGIGGALLVGMTTLLFGDTALLLAEGTINRFSTLSTAFTDDISLINRFTESRSALKHVQYNPILGHGYGTTFAHFSMVFQATDIRSHIHIGYVDILFRMGVWGGFCAAFLWIRGMWQGFAVYRTSVALPIRLYGLASCAVLVGMIFSVLTESPWYQMNQMFGFVVLIAGAEGFAQATSTVSRAEPERGLYKAPVQ